MVYLPKNISRIRLKEAQNARNNRVEISKALHSGQITRRDLMKWGLMTPAGVLIAKHGLSSFAPSAYAGGSIPVGTPPSPTFGEQPFTQPMQRLDLQQPQPLTPSTNPDDNELEAVWPGASGETLNARRLSYHDEFTNSGGIDFVNPVTGIGPAEGRPPTEFFGHQRWREFFPKVGYPMTISNNIDNFNFFTENLPAQARNAIWSFNSGRFTRASLPPPLIKVRYGEPAIVRVYNGLPRDRNENGGFGVPEFQIHNHNAHNSFESDGAANVHIFRGQFFDYHWGTCLAGTDFINTDATDPRASGPDDSEGLMQVPGDFRELQSSLWFHDHRFFFTAENVYKGELGMLNYYSGPDRGHEGLVDGVNLRLPSGQRLPWGNIDFDVNLIISDGALDPDGQYFFDIFDTDGFLGDLIFVNFGYRPFMEVLPRKYRFRLLNACMSRFIQIGLAGPDDKFVPFDFIQNDGNFVVNPIRNMQVLDELGVAERYDIVVDFSRFSVGDKVRLVNVLEHDDGRGPKGTVRLADALAGESDDPVVGAVMEFRIVDQLESVDEPGHFYTASNPNLDPSQVPDVLTEQIPIVEPVRERVIEWKRGATDPRDNFTGDCIPDCGDREDFPWGVRVNGETTHSFNAHRISNLIPKPGEVEHWTFVNGGGGWDHPIHLHFEEGITMNRGGASIPQSELLVRKDVWRLRRGGSVKFQIQFREFGGSYVNHCHNTVHEDNAMLNRVQWLSDGGPGREATAVITPTPNPQPEGVTFYDPNELEILPEGDPRGIGSGGGGMVADNNGTEGARRRARARSRRRRGGRGSRG